MVSPRASAATHDMSPATARMQERGVEPLHLAVQDPKSCASANSATPAGANQAILRSGQGEARAVRENARGMGVLVPVRRGFQPMFAVLREFDPGAPGSKKPER